jgi:type IV pilus assembly protein PilF
MKFITSLILTLSLVACATSGKEDPATTKALLHLQVGTAHLMKGNYPLALKELLEAERLDPKEPTIQNNLGLAYLVREKYDDAEKHFKNALELNNNYTDARNNLGRLYIDVGLYPKAIQELETAAADLTYEQPEKSWSNLGQAYFMATQYQKAKLAFQNSLKNRHGSCFTMNYYGRALFELKEFKTAAESLDQAVKLCEKSNFDEPHFYSAMSFYKLGRVEQARARCQEILQLYPNSLYAKKARELLEIMQ